MAQRDRSRGAILAWGDAGELAELAVQVRLVAVAGGECDLGERQRRAGGEQAERVLEPKDATIELRPEPNRTAKQGDEPTMAIAGLRHHLTNVGSAGEARERVRDRRVHSMNLRESG